MKKEDNRIRDARIMVDILEKCNKNVNIDYKEISIDYDVHEEYIYEQVRKLNELDFLEVYDPPMNSPVIEEITDKGKSYKEYELVERAIEEVRNEKIIEKRARRSHKLKGYKIWQIWIGFFGVIYFIIDILLKSIAGKGILDLIF